ncbi:MAG: ADP-ribosylglycohydrolase family protein [Clostridia bacterium]|nr:ADP-ribosylglycohydrolase family protein [Clostridia bacterium]
MELNESIKKIRTDAKLSQENFAALFDVSQQSVQKWENGSAVPELSKLVKISKHFGVSLDALIMGNDNRMVEEMKNTATIRPQYESIHNWEFYSSNLITEYTQSTEEGLDIERYKDVFLSVAQLPKDEIKKKLGDVLFELVANARQKEGYSYNEPSDLNGILALCSKHKDNIGKTAPDADKITGAWYGRICGCMLGKTVEGVRTHELIPFLKDSENYPMHRYIYSTDMEKTDLSKYKYGFASRAFADKINGMPVDDDTNYLVLAQLIIERYGRDFSPFDVSRAWLDRQKKDAYCTAERVAFCNFVKGYAPPASAVYKNPYREWIGAQIRGDYFGYINPGNPEKAAEMAWRDASISHTKNGIYGEMFVSAMLAVAAVRNDMREIVLGGLDYVPRTSRLYEAISTILSLHKAGTSEKECFEYIHSKYDENTAHGWCHTIPNAMIVAAALLYGNGDYGRSICMAVQTGFDTDCNGATVGSVIGMARGIDCIDKCWTDPINGILHTSIFGVGTVKIADMIEKTLKHASE